MALCAGPSVLECSTIEKKHEGRKKLRKKRGRARERAIVNSDFRHKTVSRDPGDKQGSGESGRLLMTARGNERIFGVPLSFPSDIYSEVQEHPQSSEVQQGREEEKQEKQAT